jgi:hypothetical protein
MRPSKERKSFSFGLLHFTVGFLVVVRESGKVGEAVRNDNWNVDTEGHLLRACGAATVLDIDKHIAKVFGQMPWTALSFKLLPRIGAQIGRSWEQLSRHFWQSCCDIGRGGGRWIR